MKRLRASKQVGGQNAIKAIGDWYLDRETVRGMEPDKMVCVTYDTTKDGYGVSHTDVVIDQWEPTPWPRWIGLLLGTFVTSVVPFVVFWYLVKE